MKAQVNQRGQENQQGQAKTRGRLASEARRIAAASGVSLRQAYRYAAAGREPSPTVRIGVDNRRYHVHLHDGPCDYVRTRRIRYTVAMVAKLAHAHGINNKGDSNC